MELTLCHFTKNFKDRNEEEGWVKAESVEIKIEVRVINIKTEEICTALLLRTIQRINAKEHDSGEKTLLATLLTAIAKRHGGN
jgi:hypothetical protein